LPLSLKPRRNPKRRGQRRKKKKRKAHRMSSTFILCCAGRLEKGERPSPSVRSSLSIHAYPEEKWEGGERKKKSAFLNISSISHEKKASLPILLYLKLRRGGIAHQKEGGKNSKALLFPCPAREREESGRDRSGTR